MHIYFTTQASNTGTGSELNPYPAADAASLDSHIRPYFMRGDKDMCFHFAPSETPYRCWGMGDADGDDGSAETSSTYGFRLWSGWRFEGFGMGASRLIHEPHPERRALGVTATLFGLIHHANNCAVRDLAIDCNWPAFAADDKYTGVMGIGGRVGNRLRIERCEITNAGGRAIDTAGAIFIFSIVNKSQDVRVTDNWIHSFAEDGGSNAHGCTGATNNHHTTLPEDATLTAIITGNRIEARGSLALGWQSADVVMRDNIVKGFSHGIFCDTGYLYRNLYEANQISNVGYPIAFISGWYNAAADRAAVERCIFRGNVIDVMETGLGLCAMSHAVADGTVTNFRNNYVIDNIIRYTSGTMNARPGLQIAAGLRNENNLVRGNIVSPELLVDTPNAPAYD